MRLDPTAVMQALYPDIHPVHVKILLFRLRCLSHRLMCFGFENYVNQYDPRDKVLLGTLMAQRQHDALVMEAHKDGDTTLKEWLETHLPNLFARAA